MTRFRSQFDRDLEAIDGKVIELLGMVVEDLAVAAQAFPGGSGETAVMLAGRDQLIDALSAETEELAVRQILLQAPVAADLRFLLTVLRVAPELERSHDLIVHIAARSSRIPCGDLPPGAAGLAGQMADLAALMWRQAADAWYGPDPFIAPALAMRRDEMEQMHSDLTTEIAAAGMTALATMEMAQAARDYQRLGAHAHNIARRVTYLAGTAGENGRHR